MATWQCVVTSKLIEPNICYFILKLMEIRNQGTIIESLDIHIHFIIGYASGPIEVLCTGDEDGILIDDIFAKNPLDKIDGHIPGKKNNQFSTNSNSSNV